MSRLILAFPMAMLAAACAANKPPADPVAVACIVPTVAVARAAPKQPLTATPPKASSEPATRSATPTTPPVAADNTSINARDRANGAVTPMNQGNGELDIKTTAQIRWAVMGDGSLSFTAKNVKIITQDGKVTLRGPVNTAGERSAIEAAAKKVAGDSHVDDQLEVTK